MGSCLPSAAGGMQRIPTLRSMDMVVLRRKLRKKMAQVTYAQELQTIPTQRRHGYLGPPTALQGSVFDGQSSTWMQTC